MSSVASIVRIGEQRDVLGECPIWHDDQRALYWVDIRLPAVRRYDIARRRVEIWPMPGLVGSIAFAKDGRLLVALEDSISLFDPATRELEPIAAPPTCIPGHRFNDGRCDRRGRFWVGTMHNVTRAPEGALFRLEGRGVLVEQLAGICIPNSLAWSPDGRTMYFADSLLHTIYAYEYDATSGRMGRRRVFATTQPPAFPDGSTVDAEGFLWNAEFDGARVVRYAPDGRIDRVIEVPVSRPTCCTFGGPMLETLFITSASQKMTSEQLRGQPLAGALLAVDVGVRGLLESRFAL